MVALHVHVSFYRFPPTCCAPRSLSPLHTTSPSWQRRSTRLPRHVCSLPSSRRGWAPGWRSPQSRTSSLSLPEPGGCQAQSARLQCRVIPQSLASEPGQVCTLGRAWGVWGNHWTSSTVPSSSHPTGQHGDVGCRAPHM